MSGLGLGEFVLQQDLLVGASANQILCTSHNV